MEKYDHLKIEPKWQKFWEENKTFEATEDDTKESMYVLDMFPYPSGTGLHVGHPMGYIGTDIVSRYYRMKGKNVLHPMGWDAFGLPAENYAIQNQLHPRVAVEQNVDRFRVQLKALGFSYDWSREMNTTDPEYYKWTQWIFLQLYELGLAYESDEPINWCPKDKTGLANEEVVDGKCDRCGADVERKKLRQWVLKITEYAEDLLKGLEGLQWPPRILEMQRNWIGKSTGAEINFKVKDSHATIKVYTTRPDTLFGATYMVIAPEHDLVHEITSDLQKEAVDDYCETAANKSDLERQENVKEKTGIFTGAYAINPINGEELPIWVADYVLANYGTGAIMAVPAHDERDFDFAKKFDLSIRQVISSDAVGHELDEAFVGDGKLVNSGDFDGLDVEAGKQAIVKKLEELGVGEAAINYKLHDWIFSRQRYWGEPIPMIHCEKCGVVPVPEEDLPVELPEVEKYEPTGTGESPLAAIEEWVNVSCPKCDASAKRETNTMPQWAGSSWYFLRFADPHNKDEAFSAEAMKRWMPVDIYVGGAEHAVLHLLYARFWTKALKNAGFLDFDEPFMHLRNQGLIMGEDGYKMSKSRGNVISPDDVVAEHGADGLRVYEMFMGPFDEAKPWDTKGIQGISRFLKRVWELQDAELTDEASSDEFQGLLHKTIKKVTKDIESFNFNTAISQMMVLANKASKQPKINKDDLASFVKILNPFAPHMTEEMWQRLGNDGSVALAEWPEFEDAKTADTEVEIPVQVNGKVRAKLVVPPGAAEAEVLAAALKEENVTKHLNGADPKKVIYIPGRMLSLVI